MASNPYKKTPFSDLKNVKKISKQTAKKEADQLREAIEYHNQKYYLENNPSISDKSYDKLLHYLQEIEEEFPDLKTDTSPTQKVGAPPLENLKKKKHKAEMLSLNSSDNEKKIKDFFHTLTKEADQKNATVILEPKLDGLSVEIYYEKGKFNYAATRGDGETGEDISENVKTISSLPLKLRSDNYPDSLSIRGEIFLPAEGFQKVNQKKVEKGEEPFANARNAAAGIVRQLDSKKVADMPLEIFAYEILYSSKNQFSQHWEMLQQLPEWGLKTSPENKSADSYKKIKQYYKELSEKREQLPYEIDGIVIKLDNKKLRDKMGVRERSPRWAYAWKFQPRKEKTTLRKIVVQVGRTGILTPVALFDPVDIGGVTVSRATLHNKDEVKKKDVREGDTIQIKRAGDVIPEVVKRSKKAGKNRGKAFEMPEKCPVCGTSVKKEGSYIICPAGLSCEAQLKGSLSHFVSKGAMNIENLGEKNIAQLVDKGLIRNIPDIFKLKSSDFQKLEGFGRKSSEKIYNAIQDSKNPSLSNFLYALGIRHMGKHIARIIAKHFHTLENIQEAKIDEIRSVDEIGEETAQSISNFFSAGENQKMLNELKELGIEIKSEEKKSDILKNKNFVITGSLTGYSRDEIKEKIESLGGNATSSVSSNTDYLILGEGPGSKLEEAKEHNVKIIDEEEFNEMI